MRAALEALAGVDKVKYDPHRDLFTMQFDPEQLEVAAMLAAVTQAGRKMGRQYFPQLIA